jgi:hypothetical protein
MGIILELLSFVLECLLYNNTAGTFTFQSKRHLGMNKKERFADEFVFNKSNASVYF